MNVTLSDGDRVAGRVVGTDSRSDLALVKIDGGPYSPLPLGKLDEVEIGESVVAIGYALDLAQGERAVVHGDDRDREPEEPGDQRIRADGLFSRRTRRSTTGTAAGRSSTSAAR